MKIEIYFILITITDFLLLIGCIYYMKRKQSAFAVRTKQMENQENEMLRLVSLIDRSTNLIVLADHQQRIQFMNPAGMKLIGFANLDEARKHVLLDLRSPRARKDLKANFNSLETEGHWEGETEYINQKTGETFVVLVNAFFIQGLKGSPDMVAAIVRNISNEKKTEQTLKNSEANLSSLIENARDAFWSLDTNLNLIIFNSYCLEECLNSYGTLIKNGMPLEEVIPLDKFPKEHEYWKKLYKRALAGEIFSEEQSYEVNSVRKYYLTSFYPILSEGKISGVTVFSKEITELKKINLKLERNISLLLATFEASADGILAVDHRGRIISFNSKFVKMWGIPNEIIKQKNDQAAIQFVMDQLIDPAEFMSKVEYLYAHPRDESYDVIAFKDGKFFERFSLPQILGEDIIGRVWTFRDITARTRVESDLKQASEEIYDLYNNAPCGYHNLDKEGYFTRINNTELKWLGYDREELVGKKKASELMTPASFEIFNRNFPKFIERGFSQNVEYEFYRKDGSVMPVLLNAIAIKNENGDMIEGRATIFNIEERKKNEEELQKAKRIVDESLKYREQFLANISHEVRTPIGGIIGLIDLLSYTPLNAEQNELLNIMKTSTDNLVVIINDILDMSKIDAGKMELEEHDFRLSEVLQNAVALLKPKTLGKNLTISIDQDTKLPEVLMGDAVRLNQILLNLLSNSIKFTEKGSIVVSTKLITEENNQVRFFISVKDTGIGIPSEKLEFIFDSFTQAEHDTSRKYGGTGLGLSIVKRLAEMMGGTINVKSKVGEGTEFTVELLLKKPMLKEPIKKDTPLLENEIPLKNSELIRILIAEDHPVNQLLVVRILKRWGMEAEVAENGSECLKMLTRKKYDLILMDIQMPLMNGYEATQQIRTTLQEPLKKIPIIAMTAYATQKEKEKCLRSGMNDYISKPFKANDLLSKIKNLLHVELELSGSLVNSIKNQKNENSPNDLGHERITDLTYIVELAAGSEEFVNDMLEIFIRQTPGNLQNMKKLSEQKDWENLKALAHRMKPSISFVGIKQLEETMETLESYSENQFHTDEIPELVHEVETLCIRAIKELEEELKIRTS